jgi:hypothetical protein
MDRSRPILSFQKKKDLVLHFSDEGRRIVTPGWKR